MGDNSPGIKLKEFSKLLAQEKNIEKEKESFAVLSLNMETEDSEEEKINDSGVGSEKEERQDLENNNLILPFPFLLSFEVTGCGQIVIFLYLASTFSFIQLWNC